MKRLFMPHKRQKAGDDSEAKENSLGPFHNRLALHAFAFPPMARLPHTSTLNK
jgi:hypothetical protein